jgi:DNA-directed RNA polymerase specialized sigma24 family protein
MDIAPIDEAEGTTSQSSETSPARMRQILEGLSLTERVICLLDDVGFSINDIARAVDLPSVVIKSVLADVREKVRQSLK